MCGIVGVLYRDPERPVERPLLEAMLAKLAHRGPDGEGVLIDGNFGMGIRRLAIVDLETGDQPIFNEDERIGLVFNGEIYNQQELRSELEASGHAFRSRSDTEVLVHGYESWGMDLPARLNGMFAFCLWDRADRRVILARDRVGIKPLYVYSDGTVTAWASEIKALLVLPNIAPEVDEEALLDFLSLGYVPGPRTLFRGIRKMQPATITSLWNERVTTKTYWHLHFAPAAQPASVWHEEIRALVDSAVKAQLMSDVPLGAFLSGGIDSSSIVSTMKRVGVEKISTYAIGFGAEDGFHDELPKARAIADALGTNHHEIVVRPDVAELIFPLITSLDEPITDTSFIVTYLVSRLASEGVKVILSGVGGDEVFAGYRRYLWPIVDRYLQPLPDVVRRKVLLPAVQRLPVDRGSSIKATLRYARGFLEQADEPAARRYQRYVGVFRPPELEQILTPDMVNVARRHRADRIAEAYEASGTSDPLNSMLYADLQTSLVDSLLTLTDKMSMAVSLEARVPLLDHRLIELAARIPPSMKVQGPRGLKHIFKGAMSDRLSPKTLRQRKQGFGTPISRWMRDELRGFMRERLSPAALAGAGFFKPEAGEALSTEHLNQTADHSERLLALLTFGVWYETFIEGARKPDIGIATPVFQSS